MCVASEVLLNYLYVWYNFVVVKGAGAIQLAGGTCPPQISDSGGRGDNAFIGAPFAPNVILDYFRHYVLHFMFLSFFLVFVFCTALYISPATVSSSLLLIWQFA